MGARNDHGGFGTTRSNFRPDPTTELEHERLREKRAADAQALHAAAYREMPSDLRERAREWGVEALMNAVWMNGWECGYRQSNRDRVALSQQEDHAA